jgi:hypothetical protein
VTCFIYAAVGLAGLAVLYYVIEGWRAGVTSRNIRLDEGPRDEDAEEQPFL